MLEIEDALKAKRTLDDWIETNKASPLTPDEALTLEAILLSPVGKRASANLRDILWIIRDLCRSARGPIADWDMRGGVTGILGELETYRDNRGHSTTKSHLDTAREILKSPIGTHASSNVARLDAAVTLLFEIVPKKKEGDQ